MDGGRVDSWVYKTSTVQIQSVYNIFETSPYWMPSRARPWSSSSSLPEPIGWPSTTTTNVAETVNSINIERRGKPEDEANKLLKQYLLLNHPSDRLIVLGDLNDTLMDPVQHNVFRMFRADSSRYRCADHALAQGPNYYWSYPTWPSHLDHMLISNELFSFFPDPSAGAQIVRVDDFLPNGWADYDQFLSDHRPVGLKIPFSSSIGSEEEQEAEVHWLVPNPTSKDVEIDLSELSNTETVEIRAYDANGKCVLEERYRFTDSVRIQLPEAQGMYTIHLVSGDQRRTARVLGSDRLAFHEFHAIEEWPFAAEFLKSVFAWTRFFECGKDIIGRVIVFFEHSQFQLLLQQRFHYLGEGMIPRNVFEFNVISAIRVAAQVLEEHGPFVEIGISDASEIVIVHPAERMEFHHDEPSTGAKESLHDLAPSFQIGQPGDGSIRAKY